MGHDPSANERQSIANAIQLIREANYREEANLLDDLLQDNRFDISDLLGGAVGQTKKWISEIRWGQEITLDPRIIPERTILDRCSADMIELAGTILHEGIHVQCHDELAAYGTEIAFYKILQERKNIFFRECAETSAIELGLVNLIQEVSIFRREIAKQGGRGYGNRERGVLFAGAGRLSETAMRNLAQYPDASPLGKASIELMYPDDPRDAISNHLFRIGNAIWEYWKRKREFPEPPNSRMVTLLEQERIYYFNQSEELIDGEVVDYWRNPYYYSIKGSIFPRYFDLYSFGPNGVDDGGRGDDILYIPRRK